MASHIPYQGLEEGQDTKPEGARVIVDVVHESTDKPEEPARSRCLVRMSPNTGSQSDLRTQTMPRCTLAPVVQGALGFSRCAIGALSRCPGMARLTILATSSHWS
jgi:hypothetical protein